MHEYTVLLPLAQLNTNVGGAGGNTPAPTPSPPAAPAPVVEGGTAVPPVVPPAAPAAANTSTSAPGTAPPAGAVDAGKPSPLGGLSMYLPIILMFVVLYFFLFRGQRKEEKKRKLMISELKKGDRIMTIGGMIARVVSIDGEEVVLKIDESANVKATYTKKSIQEVLDRDDKK